MILAGRLYSGLAGPAGKGWTSRTVMTAKGIGVRLYSRINTRLMKWGLEDLDKDDYENVLCITL